MNTKEDTTSATNSMFARFPHRIGPALLTLVAALALALMVAARAETPPPAIPFSDIGARTTATYQGDALGITTTADGARLCCGFQKLEGHATPEGLWLESTKPGAVGRLRLLAVAVGRGGKPERPHPLTEAASSVRSGMSIVTVPQGDQAPLRATCKHRAVSVFDMPLLTELETTFSEGRFYEYAAPNGAIACPGHGTQTLARTGQVSVDDKLVRFSRPGLTEEYSVSVDGVRQDFIIESPPLNPPPSAVLSILRSATEDGLRRTGQPSTLNQSMRMELALSGARAEATASGARLTLVGSGRALAYSRLRVEDATGRQLTARLEVLSPDRLAVSVADVNATYPVRIDPTFSDADWVSLGSGMDGAVDALAVSGANLYAGGAFNTAGGVRANYIAKWDGIAWSALGSGMNDTVRALAVSGTNLYAGGDFITAAGGVYARYIAKWDGSAWSALGSGFNGGVYALGVSGTNLYAGGVFAMTDGGVYCIAKLGGSGWSALGSGIGGDFSCVYALAVSGADLYAGGYFNTAGGVPANYIAKWDGSAWSALSSGMSSEVYALAVSGTNLYAGGTFTTADGVPANYIAKWDGSTWSALGPGLNGSVRALAVRGTNLYAGGYFTTAGGVPANYIAKWDGSAWSALGSGVNSYVQALAADGAGHLFVGGAFAHAGTNVSNFIAQANVEVLPTNGPPVIVASPASLAVPIGGTADFQVEAGGSPPLVYQWVFNGRTRIVGATASVLSLTNVQLTQAGVYSVTVTNLYGAVTSAWAVLTVTGVPPVIVASPASLPVLVGATADFQVGAAGSPPLVYQWVFNGTTAIAGATGSVLSLTNVQLTQAGTYCVTVTNLYGAATSAPALLQVFPPGIVVTNSETALRAAMSVGGTVTFACDGTITLASTITNTADTTLDASGHQITISGNGAVRVFYVSGNVNFSVINLTVANGFCNDWGAGILNDGGMVNLIGVTFTGNRVTVSSYGGGGTGRGGAICNRGQLAVQSSSFLTNQASGARGGDGCCVFDSPGGSGGSGLGGALDNQGTASIASSTFAGNVAYGGQGGAGVGDHGGGKGGGWRSGRFGRWCSEQPGFYWFCQLHFCVEWRVCRSWWQRRRRWVLFACGCPRRGRRRWWGRRFGLLMHLHLW